MTALNIIAALALVATVWVNVLNMRRTRALQARLSNLRANCFVTNERGHRTRYAHASPEVRARVETTTGVTTNG